MPQPKRRFPIPYISNFLHYQLQSASMPRLPLTLLSRLSHSHSPSPLYIFARSASSSSTPASPPSSSRLQPTTFSSKAVPREIHERPEERRPIPSRSKVESSSSSPASSSSSSSTSTTPTSKSEHDFSGPSKPRMVYDRPKEARALPSLKVSQLSPSVSFRDVLEHGFADLIARPISLSPVPPLFCLCCCSSVAML